MSDATEQLRNFGNAVGLTVVDESLFPVVLIGKDLNVTGRRLGEIVARLDLFEMNGEQVSFNHLGKMEQMTGRRFCTWINDHVLMAEGYDKAGHPIPGMLKIDQASVILDCLNFKRGVRHLRAVNQVRLPVLRAGGALEKLPWGYDNESETYTVPGGLDYLTDVDLEAGKGVLERIFGTFPFTDDRSKAVQVAGMLALFVKHLPGGTGLRPGLLGLANKPESGKSVLMKACLYPVLGTAAAAKMKKNEDLDKELEAFCRASVPYIFLDNVYGGIQSASIDQLLTSEESTGRAMGGHGIFTAKNTALLLVTGNKLELNEDAARRFLVVDLFEKGDPCDRPVAEGMILDDEVMKSDQWRGKVLAVLWSLVANWHAAGMPKGSVIMGSFENFSRLIGGVVEAAGYVPPCQRAVIPDSINPEKEEFAELVGLLMEDMGEQREKDYAIEDLARFARAGQLFQKQVGTQEEGKKLTIKEDGLGREERGMAEDRGYLTPAMRSSFGKLVAGKLGGEPKWKGRRVEFGKRSQSRKSTFTVRLLD